VIVVDGFWNKIAAKCIANRVKESNYKYYKRRTNRIH